MPDRAPAVPAAAPHRSIDWTRLEADLTGLAAAHAAGDETFVRAALERIAEAANAPRASLSLADGEDDRFHVRVVLGLPDSLLGAPIANPRSVSAFVAREERGLVLQGRAEDGRFEGLGGAWGSSLCVPVLGADGALGLVNLARPAGASAFGEADLEGAAHALAPLANLLERRARTALGEAFASAVERARAASRPSLPADGEPLEFRHYALAAARRDARAFGAVTCGQLTHLDGSHTVYLLETRGSKAESFGPCAFLEGLLAGAQGSDRPLAWLATLAHLRTHSRFGPAPARAFWIAHLGRGGRVTSCNTGVAAPFWIPADGGPVTRIANRRGEPHGEEHAALPETESRLLPGDRLVIASAGLTGAPDAAGEPLGEARLLEALESARPAPVESLARAAVDAAMAHAGRRRPHEDALALVLEFRPAA